MRVDLAVVVRLVLGGLVRVLVGVVQVDHVGDVEDPTLGVLLDRLVDGGLEAVLDDDQVGAGQGDGTCERRLDVVRLHARVGQADDVDVAPPTRSATQARG